MPREPSRILLIEDEPLHAQTIEAMLTAEDSPISVAVAESMQRGLSLLKDERFDLILLDLSLPDSDGIATFSRLQDETPNLPIVVLTASGDDELAVKTMQAGAQDYLVKWEIDPGLLRRSIRYAIERKRFETERRARERTIRRIAQALPEIVALIEFGSGRLSFVNDQITRALGYSQDISGSLSIYDLAHPEDLPRLNDQFKELIASPEEEVRQLEYRVKRSDGEWRWLDCRHIVYRRYPEATRHQILCAAHDVTERKKSEQALMLSEARYRDLVENSGLFVWTHDPEGKVLSVNQYALDFFGWKSGDEIVGRMMSDFLPENRKSQFRSYLTEILTRGEASGVTSVITPRRGKIIIEYSNTLGAAGLYHDESAIVRCIARDVTEQASAKADLHKSEERLRFALDAAGLGAWEWKIEADTVVGDELTERLLGIKTGSYNQFLEKVHPEDREQVRAKVRQSLETGVNQGLQFRVIINEGQIRWMETQARTLYESANNPVRVIGVIRDITEKKLLETEIYRSQRLESIGALASGIAHDLNNVLAPILMALHTLQQRSTDDVNQRWLSLIYKSAVRGRDLIEQMISFAKGASGEHVPLKINPLAEDIAKILCETLPKNIEIELNLPEDLWGIAGDATQIHQVLMNLCINARDALPAGGKISISAENCELAPEDVRMHAEVEPGRFIRLTIADNGIGIPPHIIERIFEPFFTTKEKGKGTGLGLSTVLGIVRGHGGFMTVHSDIGRGASFRVYLPSREFVQPEKAETSFDEPLNGMGELILIVDDEPDICEVAKNTLEECGYRVLTAYDGLEAIDIFEQRRDEIQIVLTDMMMPTFDGPSTIRALKDLNPNVKIIATSGIRSTGKLAEAAKAGVTTFLAKPYTAEKLLITLAKLLKRY